MNIIKNIIRKFSYVYMRISILMAYTVCILLSILTLFFKLFIKKPKNKLAIFMHSPTFSDGYFRRFTVFFKYFNNNEIKFKVFSYLSENKVRKVYNTFTGRYLMYQRIAWIRAFQIPFSVFFSTIILQRNLFPLYPDYKKPFFEKIMRKLNNYIIWDVWDPIHLWHPVLTNLTIKYVDKISVNTKLLKKFYSKNFNPDNIFIWPIAVNTNWYIQKNDFTPDKNSIKLFYTGSPGSVNSYLLPLIPVLENLSNKYTIELNIVSASKVNSNYIKVRNYEWSEDIIRKLLSTSDLGLYPNFQKDKTKNFAVAGKVLDYLGSKLPIVGADQGLPDGIEPNKILLVANELKEWESALIYAFENYAEMQKKAETGFSFVKENLSVKQTYNTLKKHIK